MVVRNSGLLLMLFDTVIYRDFLESKTGIFVAIINSAGVLTAQLQMLNQNKDLIANTCSHAVLCVE